MFDNNMSLQSTFIFILLYSVCIASNEDQYNCNASTDPLYKSVVWNGMHVCITVDLEKKIELDANTWHWMPWTKTRTIFEDDVLREVKCLIGNSIDSFPDGLLTEEQLTQGGVVLYVLFGIYSFTLLAFVCNDYFIPTVETICETLKIPQDIAAATFMSVATSCPEFFVNTISTFLTQSDMGIGTIVGSAIFNALGVAALGGLAAIRPIKIDKRAVTRDVVIYMINLSVLVTIIWDGSIVWYEAIVLLVLYVFYFVLMFNSVRLYKMFNKLIVSCSKNNDHYDMSENDKVAEGVVKDAFDDSHDKSNIMVIGLCAEKDHIVEKAISKDSNLISSMVLNVLTVLVPSVLRFFSTTYLRFKLIDYWIPGAFNLLYEIGNQNEAEEPSMSLWKFPMDKPLSRKLWWLYCWPINLILGFTIPSPVTCKKFYPLTFVMCIVWIGLNSYCVTWAMTVIGHTFLIPDSVMGMTFLAFGGCLPEACAIFIMSRRGEGGMGVSNALGANSLAILFALGLPWVIRTMTLLTEGSDSAIVYINSNGIEFVVCSILVAVASLWITLFFGKFTLKKIVGGVLACLYVIFVTLALLVETGIILDKDIPLC